MTGEMLYITQEGEDQDGEIWQTHAAIAKAVRGTLQPFDKYQGPYISVGPDLRAGNTPYAVPIKGFVRLWLIADDDWMGRVYREDTDTFSDPFPMHNTALAVEMAQGLLG